MKLVGYVLSWTASVDPTTAGYKIYWENDGSQPDYLSNSFDAGNITTVDINNITGFPGIEGDITLGLTAYDAVGNESDMVFNTSFFDRAAPAAPTNFTVTIV